MEPLEQIVDQSPSHFVRHLEQYTVSDFLEFRASDRLILNPDFQRRDIWKPAAKVYLIDTILRGLPIPKMYFRTLIDPKTQSSIREVVDGQQRLRAIFAFADDDLRLTARAREFAGLRYTTLDETLQQQFLSYSFAAEQLINADDSAVLEIFARLNTYSVALTPAELRHAEFQGDFKWMIHEAAQRWDVLWEDFKIVGVSERVRMADDALMASIFITVPQGVTGGENSTLRRAYKNFDEEFPQADEVIRVVDGTLDAIVKNLSDAIVGPLARAPHFVMVFAAAAHVLYGIGKYPVDWLPKMDTLPKRPPKPKNRDQWEGVRDNLLELGSVISQPEAPDAPELERFWRASRGATVNIKSRAARFGRFLDAFSV
jgi:Protein of unknown function DUF262